VLLLLAADINGFLSMSRKSLRGSLHSVNASAWLAVVGLPLVLAIGMFAACWTGVSQHSTCSLLPSYNSPISGRVMNLPPVNSRKWKPWLKSHRIRVAALIFYGRREYVRCSSLANALLLVAAVVLLITNHQSCTIVARLTVTICISQDSQRIHQAESAEKRWRA